MRILQEDGRFHETKNSVQDEIPVLNTKKRNISIKNPGLKLISADWRPVNKNLESGINLRHY